MYLSRRCRLSPCTYRKSVYSVSSPLSFGRIVFRKIDKMVVTTTEEPPKMVTNHCGNSCRHPSAWVMPDPSATETPTIIMVRLVKPAFWISLIPVMAIMENTEMVAPPSTQDGIPLFFLIVKLI